MVDYCNHPPHKRDWIAGDRTIERNDGGQITRVDNDLRSVCTGCGMAIDR
jgi:hypothetical protein